MPVSRQPLFVLLVVLCAVAAVLGPAGTARAAGPSPASSHGCNSVTAFTPPPATDAPFGVTQGPGGTWYAEGDRIVRMASNGSVTQYVLPDAATADAGWLTWAGGDVVWFADRGTDRLGTVTVNGAIQEWTLPAGAVPGIGPGGMVVTGGAVWFTDPANDRIGRFDVAARTFTMFTVPTAGAFPLGITLGPDGALWFVERLAAQVARITPDGVVREWALTPGAFPNRIVVGPDGALWFTELRTSSIGHITVDGDLEEVPLPGGPVGITTGPNGAVYVALWTAMQVARLDADRHVLVAWAVPGALLVAWSAGAVWATDPFHDSVARVRVGCPMHHLDPVGPVARA